MAEPTAEHIAEARRALLVESHHVRCQCTGCARINEIAPVIAAAEARGFERGIEKAATVCEEMYAAWLADPEIRGAAGRALNEYANMGREIRAIKEPR